jgi:prepilin-type N-terminal cleavage/methylation domain-containing protein
MTAAVLRSQGRRGFSLIELVIVVVILGIIGAIAVPRLSRGAEGASESALKANLAALRGAIDLYAAEHNGAFPPESTFEDAMLLFSDVSGTTSTTKSDMFPFGPYLRALPPLPVGALQGNNGVAASSGTGVGWIYTQANGTIRSNTTDSETNSGGTPWNSF